MSVIKKLALVWLLIGIPLFVFISLWGNSIWTPFPLASDESFSYYLVWLAATFLIYVIPIILIIYGSLLVTKNRGKR